MAAMLEGCCGDGGGDDEEIWRKAQRDGKKMRASEWWKTNERGNKNTMKKNNIDA